MPDVTRDLEAISQPGSQSWTVLWFSQIAGELGSVVPTMSFPKAAVRGFGRDAAVHWSDRGLFLVAIYAAVDTILRGWSAFHELDLERVYFAMGVTSAWSRLVRTTLGDQLAPPAQSLRVLMLGSAVGGPDSCVGPAVRSGVELSAAARVLRFRSG